MELKEYLRLWYLQYGDRGCPNTHVLVADSDLDYELWEEANDAGFIRQPRYGDAGWGVSTITPKGLEFIKNGN